MIIIIVVIVDGIVSIQPRIIIVIVTFCIVSQSPTHNTVWLCLSGPQCVHVCTTQQRMHQLVIASARLSPFSISLNTKDNLQSINKPPVNAQCLDGLLCNDNDMSRHSPHVSFYSRYVLQAVNPSSFRSLLFLPTNDR